MLKILTRERGQNQSITIPLAGCYRMVLVLLMLIGQPSQRAAAQSEIGRLSFTKGIKLEQVQAFGVGDSLFVAYEELKYPERRRVGTWVVPGIQPQLFLFNEFPDGNLINVDSRGGQNFFYFIEGKQNLVLRMVQMRGSEKITLPDFFMLRGSYLGSFKDKYLHILCLDKSDDFLRSYIIDGVKLVAEHTIPFPSVTKNIKAKRVEFFDGKANLSTGSARIKVIREEDVLYIVDENFNNSRSAVCRIDLKTYVHTISEFDWQAVHAWTTFVSKDILYKFNGSPKASFLELYNLSSKEKLRSFQLDFVGINGNGYVRGGEKPGTGKMFEFRPFKALLDTRASLTVITVPGDRTIAKVGRYLESHSSFPLNATSPAALAVSAGIVMASEGLRMLGEPDGYNSFVYRIVDPHAESIQLAEGQSFLSKRVDDYESTQEGKNTIKLRGYVNLEHSFVAMYLFNDELQVVKFEL